MNEIEHLIGIRRAAGYDEADVRELVEGLNDHRAVAFAVELTEPATTRGAVVLTDAQADALDRLLDAYLATTGESDEWVPHLEAIRTLLSQRGR